MRGCGASQVEEVSSLGVALSASLLGCGDACLGLDSQGVFASKFSAARSQTEDKELGLPMAREGCVRLKFGLEHRLTPFAFVTIGLQCIDKLSEDPQLILRSTDQIQFRRNSTKVLVEIDPEDVRYTTSTAVGNRVCLMEQVLSKLATFVSSPYEDDPAYPIAITNLWKHYAGNTVFTTDLLGLGEEPTPSAPTPSAPTPSAQTPSAPRRSGPKSSAPRGSSARRSGPNPKLSVRSFSEPADAETQALERIKTKFMLAYKLLDPTEEYKAMHWRGVCRPPLGLNSLHQVAVVPQGGGLEMGGVGIPDFQARGLQMAISGALGHELGVRGELCADCQPRTKVDLRTPAWLRTITAAAAPEWSVRDSDGKEKGRTWFQVAYAASEQVRADAESLGLGTVIIPFSHVWKPWKIECVGEACVTHELQLQLKHGCLVQLRDLLQTHRLTSNVANSLVRQLRQRLKHVGSCCCIGSYAQVFVSLEQRCPRLTALQRVDETKLRIVLTPECMQAESKEQATLITDQFIQTFKADAGYFDGPLS
ncbi:hypothetical protein GNI_170660 [Gregarina niphandrodes]|uniref:Uncharacterized protein n=1 Tax=Gregarina niphandrodes TaxID=110365 RepID=A0A023AYX1_GRENI|nr:hypothetical protein GNI_170660 [Gregarina niphandrodes]EZG43475.1 hypothetical protein GNI_170660 [Gregarina niphandrodes]|eukprot:XP_011133293.1 hypothetical protein GNI_170660 [Gregarina niphandrodes]